jgi:death-on-curing protein
VSPRFLTFDEVLSIHRDQIGRYGGSPRVLNLGLLESALAAPQAAFGGRFLHPNLFHMAAAYLYHLCQNHPFEDGNKRTAAVACRVFLRLNGLDLRPAESEFEGLVWAVASSNCDLGTIARFLESNSTPSAEPGRDPDPPHTGNP